MKNYSEFENQEIVWTPEGNPSVLNYFKMIELGLIKDYLAKEEGTTVTDDVVILFEGKSQTEEGPVNLITREHFAEMIEFENFFLNITVPVPPGNETADIAAGEPPTLVSFYDLCVKYDVTDEIQEQQWKYDCVVDDDYCVVPVMPKCKSSPRPIDFIYERKDDIFNIEKYKTDKELRDKIQTGKGDTTFIFTGFKSLYIQIFFAGTTPEYPV